MLQTRALRLINKAGTGLKNREIFSNFRGGKLDHQNIWQQIKSSIISKNANNSPLMMWLMPAELLEIHEETDDHCFKLGVPTELHKYWICNNLLEIITSEISAIYQRPFHIELQVTGRNNMPTQRDDFDRLAPQPEPMM